MNRSYSLDLSFESQEAVLDIKSQSFGKCSDCKRQRTAVAWCKNCDIVFLKENFSNWTSGNFKIDEFIRYTQLNAKKNMDFLEWIEFDQFDLIENINKRGAHSSIYSAIWMEGPKWNLDEEAELWNRNGPIKVILKRLDNSHNMNQEFVNQLYRYHRCLQNGALADCFESMGIFCWKDIVEMLWSISAGLNFIHKLGLVHGHLHGGNILIENEMNSVDAKIADTGLHGPVDKSESSQQIYGVIPFVAPEIFDGNVLTKATDIYSFGMIMWMLSAGVRPYFNKPHDEQLTQEIRMGLRPNVINGTPPDYSKLMLQCLDANPLNRPTASQIYECLGNWIMAICDDPQPSDLSNQFDAAEEIKFANLEKLNYNILSCHEGAIYFSRLLDIG